MSVTGHGALRVPNDQYMTPRWCVARMLSYVDLSPTGSRPLRFLEPCRGSGVITDTVFSRRGDAKCLHAEISEGIDYLDTPFEAIDLIITNPPFSQAMDFLVKSLSEARTVIYLLRLPFLASRARRDFFNANKPTHLMVLSSRPSFIDVCSDRRGCKATFPPGTVETCPACGCAVRPGADATDYAWFCWDRVGRVLTRAWLTVL